MNQMPKIGSSAEFAIFLGNFDCPEFRTRVQELAPEEPNLEARLDTYFAEMRFGHAFLCKRLPMGKLRILEMGAGLCLLSIWLHRLGHEVVALEPAASAFGLFEATRKTIWEHCANDVPVLIEQGAETLDLTVHGTFDFIFSINVMEHVADLEAVFRATSAVLRDGGSWLNSCPNYHVPYEPHYALPMVPFSPTLTRRVFSRSINHDPSIWNTLNFINVRTVRRLAHQNDLKPEFEQSVLYSSLTRLGEDHQFLERHQNGLVVKIYRLLTVCRLLNLTRYLPTSLNTPMIFRLRKKKDVGQTHRECESPT